MDAEGKKGKKKFKLKSSQGKGKGRNANVGLRQKGFLVKEKEKTERTPNSLEWGTKKKIGGEV